MVHAVAVPVVAAEMYSAEFELIRKGVVSMQNQFFAEFFWKHFDIIRHLAA